MLLCQESGFLVDDKLDQLLAPLSEQEQSLIRLDAVFKVRSLPWHTLAFFFIGALIAWRAPLASPCR